MTEIPKYSPTDEKDPVKRSLAREDAFAKPATFGGSRVRIRVMSGDKSLLPRKKKRKHDKRDVQFY